jgi:DNA replication and repair protein RecF
VYLQELVLEHFRCYERLEVELGPGLHILVGANACGKTSLLEAVHLLAVTKSQRTACDRELIAWGQDWGRVAGKLRGEDHRATALRVTLGQKRASSGGEDCNPRKMVEVNGVPRRRLSDIIGQATVVMFGPDDLSLAKGPPGVRRRLLNTAIGQVRGSYLADLVRYRRALRQRNEVLRYARADSQQRSLLPGWDVQLAEAGARVATARADFITALAPHAQRLHHELSAGAESLELKYRGDLAEAFDVEGRRVTMRDLLAGGLERDLGVGRTVRGPHRDELEMLVNGKPVRVYGSQGQQRTAALSVTLAEAMVMLEWTRESPIVLLDDCLSELDETRARRVLGLTGQVEQMIVTTASWDRLLGEYAQAARVFDVAGGQVVERRSDAGEP